MAYRIDDEHNFIMNVDFLYSNSVLYVLFNQNFIVYSRKNYQGNSDVVYLYILICMNTPYFPNFNPNFTYYKSLFISNLTW